ncbi:MAG: mevalonate kinase family protein [Pontibacterium sp.]
MKAIAPGKVILSGEHSVVYGAPAIALAVTEHIQATFQPDNSGYLSIDTGEADIYRLAGDQLPALKNQCDLRYHAFEAGKQSVSCLLDHAQDLLLYALAQQESLPSGCLSTTSTLPTGSGMGSSAAAIAATLLLSEQLTGRPRTLSERFELVRYCERLQHGRGSAIDAAAVTYGGLVRVQQNQISHLDCHLGEGWYRVNTGQPSVTTGQCVEAVRQAFASSSIWSEFAAITDQFIDALSDPDTLKTLLSANHQLLERIGVVPEPVAAFIRQVELQGGAAKISGAGAHQGKGGGLVLLYLPEGHAQDLCETFAYSCSPLKEDSLGARSIND